MNAPKDVIEYCLIAIAVIATAGGVWNRIKLSRGIGVRFIQYLGIAVLVPLIAVLSLEGRISQEMTGAIAIAAIGGVLASVGRDEKE
jgi:hypothetical protein